VDGNKSPTPAELTILIAGAVMFIGSFLSFADDRSSWQSPWFPIATLLAVYGSVMALQIGLTKFANVTLPDRLVGFTWEQVHLVLGILATFMAIGWLVSDIGSKNIGLWLEVLGSFSLAAGALVLQRERQTGAIG
jgi:hypothetical protein